MKKLVALILIFAMVLLAGCSGTPVISPTVPGNDPVENPTDATTGDTPTGAPEQPSGDQTVMTGLAVLPSLAKSKSAGEEPGLAQSDITLVAVNVDENGVITDCVIDAIQAKVQFGADGVITTDLSAGVPTKNELGDAYGMNKVSSIGKEWNEQMEALAQYAVGKTVEELRGIALNEKGGAADADLAASVTVSIGGYVDAIAQAAENAEYVGAASGDRLVLAAVTDLSGSKDATQEELGLAQAYATIAAVTLREDVISGCIIDAVQCNVNFDAAGEITTDLAEAPLTKNQLGDAYGMKKASSIGKEWNEQAAAFAQYVVGKTVQEVLDIAVNERGGAADADLAASVTVSLGGFQQVIAKAAP